MATFQAKKGWKRMWKKENKNNRSVLFLSDASYKNSKTISKKIKKIKKCHYGSISSQNGLEKAEKEWK